CEIAPATMFPGIFQPKINRLGAGKSVNYCSHSTRLRGKGKHVWDPKGGRRPGLEQERDHHRVLAWKSLQHWEGGRGLHHSGNIEKDLESCSTSSRSPTK